MNDPIVEEIHKCREQLAAKFNYNIMAICDYMRERQEAEGWPVWQGPGSTTEKSDEKSVADQ